MLSKTLSSFESLIIPPGIEWELIVVDNGSADDTAGVVRRFEARLPIRREVEVRRGHSVARNRALSSYRGAFILFTDDDVEVDAHWLSSTIETFERFGADVVFGRSVPVWTTSVPQWFGPLFAGQFALLDYGPEPLVISDGMHEFFGLNMAFRRTAAQALGPFREDLGYVGTAGGGADDTEMFNRARSTGLRIVYCPQSVVGHIIPADRTTKGRQRHLAWNGARTNYRMVVQEFGSYPQLFGLPRFMYRLAVTDALNFMTAALSRRPSEAFHSEIRLIRFAGLLNEAFKSAT
jgi:GT2 family glycosyltransferase